MSTHRLTEPGEREFGTFASLEEALDFVASLLVDNSIDPLFHITVSSNQGHHLTGWPLYKAFTDRVFPDSIEIPW